MEISAELPSEEELERWYGEPIKAAILPTSLFLTNKKGTNNRLFYFKFIRVRRGPIMQIYTAISRKVVRKSARDNPERYCGWF